MHQIWIKIVTDGVPQYSECSEWGKGGCRVPYICLWRVGEGESGTTFSFQLIFLLLSPKVKANLIRTWQRWQLPATRLPFWKFVFISASIPGENGHSDWLVLLPRWRGRGGGVLQEKYYCPCTHRDCGVGGIFAGKKRIFIHIFLKREFVKRA